MASGSIQESRRHFEPDAAADPCYPPSCTAHPPPAVLCRIRTSFLQIASNPAHPVLYFPLVFNPKSKIRNPKCPAPPSVIARSGAPPRQSPRYAPAPPIYRIRISFLYIFPNLVHLVPSFSSFLQSKIQNPKSKMSRPSTCHCEERRPAATRQSPRYATPTPDSCGVPIVAAASLPRIPAAGSRRYCNRARSGDCFAALAMTTGV